VCEIPWPAKPISNKSQIKNFLFRAVIGECLKGASKDVASKVSAMFSFISQLVLGRTVENCRMENPR
jgi:hypothetical protein